MNLKLRKIVTYEEIPQNLQREYHRRVEEAAAWLAEELEKLSLKPDVRIHVFDPEVKK